MRACDGPGAEILSPGPVTGDFQRHYDRIAGALHRTGARVEDKTHVLGFKGPLQFGGYFGIFARGDLRGRVDYRDLRSETREHLSKLETDISTAQDDEVLRHGGEFHER